jgi:hypothetical protein
MYGTTYLLFLVFVFYDVYTNTLCFGFQLKQDTLYYSVGAECSPDTN